MSTSVESSGARDTTRDSEAYVRSIRHLGHFDNYQTLQRLLARRQNWSTSSSSSQEPQPDSSETVIVKSLPLIPHVSPHVSHVSTPQYYTGGREPLTRLSRDPQLHSFQLERDRAEQSQQIQRGSLQEVPRSAALIAPVQNVLSEPVAAVPGAQVSSVLQPVPAVPELPSVTSFTTLSSVPTVPASSAVPTVPSVSSSSFRTSFSRGGLVTLPRSPVTVTRSPVRTPNPTLRARQRVTESTSETSSAPVISTTTRARESVTSVPRSPVSSVPRSPVSSVPRSPVSSVPRFQPARGGSLDLAPETPRSSGQSSVRSSVSSSVSSSVRHVNVARGVDTSTTVRHPELG